MSVASPNATSVGCTSLMADSTPMASDTMASMSADAKPASSPTLPVPKLKARLSALRFA